jgi:His-Xaa-Ser system protein HxsD
MSGSPPEDRSIIVTFAKGTASVDAVQRATYALSHRLAAEIVSFDEEVRCRVLPLDAGPCDLEGEFRNEVLDHVLRERIREQTASERNAILAVALSKLIAEVE